MIQHWGLWLCAAPRHCPSNLIIRFAWERSSVRLHEGTNYKEGPLSFTSWKEAQLLISGVEQIIFGTRFLGPLGKGQRGEDSGQNMPSGFNFSCSLQQETLCGAKKDNMRIILVLLGQWNKKEQQGFFLQDTSLTCFSVAAAALVRGESMGGSRTSGARESRLCCLLLCLSSFAENDKRPSERAKGKVRK